MSGNAEATIARVLLIGVLVVATLGFGLAGLCGGAFTLMMLPDLFSTARGNWSGAFLIISVPFLVFGSGLAWWCGSKLIRLLRRPSKQAQP